MTNQNNTITVHYPMPPVVKEVNKVSYEIMEKVIAKGDLRQLTSQERVMLYRQICESLNLNPLTRPFQYIEFDKKLTLYASRECTEQLRNLHTISVYKAEKEVIDGVFVYTAYLRKANGQEDIGTGAVAIKDLQGIALANAYKKAETQAKRRGTLSICGLGWCDESEVPDVPNSKPVNINIETGEIEDNQVSVIETNNDPYTIEQALADIHHANDMNELRDVFNKSYKIFKDMPEEYEYLVAAKDNKKLSLEAHS